MEQRSLSGIKYIDPICRAVNTITHRPLIPEKHGALLSVPVQERPACGLSINVVLDQSLSMQKRNVYEDLRGLLTKLADGPKPLCNAEYSIILLQDSCLSLLSDYRPCSETRGWSENTPKAKGLTPLMAAVTLAAERGRQRYADADEPPAQLTIVFSDFSQSNENRFESLTDETLGFMTEFLSEQTIVKAHYGTPASGELPGRSVVIRNSENGIYWLYRCLLALYVPEDDTPDELRMEFDITKSKVGRMSTLPDEDTDLLGFSPIRTVGPDAGLLLSDELRRDSKEMPGLKMIENGKFVMPVVFLVDMSSSMCAVRAQVKRFLEDIGNLSVNASVIIDLMVLTARSDKIHELRPFNDANNILTIEQMQLLEKMTQEHYASGSSPLCTMVLLGADMAFRRVRQYKDANQDQNVTVPGLIVISDFEANDLSRTDAFIAPSYLRDKLDILNRRIENTKLRVAKISSSKSVGKQWRELLIGKEYLLDDQDLKKQVLSDLYFQLPRMPESLF